MWLWCSRLPCRRTPPRFFHTAYARASLCSGQKRFFGHSPVVFVRRCSSPLGGLVFVRFRSSLLKPPLGVGAAHGHRCVRMALRGASCVRVSKKVHVHFRSSLLKPLGGLVFVRCRSFSLCACAHIHSENINKNHIRFYNLCQLLALAIYEGRLLRGN